MNSVALIAYTEIQQKIKKQNQPKNRTPHFPPKKLKLKITTTKTTPLYQPPKKNQPKKAPQTFRDGIINSPVILKTSSGLFFLWSLLKDLFQVNSKCPLPTSKSVNQTRKPQGKIKRLISKLINIRVENAQSGKVP